MPGVSQKNNYNCILLQGLNQNWMCLELKRVCYTAEILRSNLVCLLCILENKREFWLWTQDCSQVSDKGENNLQVFFLVKKKASLPSSQILWKQIIILVFPEGKMYVISFVGVMD